MLQGDEGGAVIYFWREVVGIASFGMTHSCGTNDYPSVYTRVYPYVDWIKAHVPDVKAEDFTYP